MDLNCLNNNSSLPIIYVTANDSNTATPPYYNAKSGGLAQVISASMARSTFSTKDIEAFLDKIFGHDSISWDVQEITKTKPITSAIIYGSLSLALFLTISIFFCISTCCCFKQSQAEIEIRERSRRKLKPLRICQFLLIGVYLIALGDLIYVAYRVDKLKASIINSIEEMNQDIYPREISEHMQYLNKQVLNLNTYFIPDGDKSILIKASKSILNNNFNPILNEKYFRSNFSQLITSAQSDIRELRRTIDNTSTIPIVARDILQNIEQQFSEMVSYLQQSLTQICDYTNRTDTDVDKQLLNALQTANLNIARISNTIQKDILSTITPWQNHLLIQRDLEEEIVKYINIAGNVLLGITIGFGVIPLIFFICVVISYSLRARKMKSSENDEYGMGELQVNHLSSDRSHRSKHLKDPSHQGMTRKEQRSSKDKSRKSDETTSACISSGAILCLMRIAYTLMFIILIVMVLLSCGLYFADLILQSGCRMVHEDQPFVVNFAINKIVNLNGLFDNSTEMNKTVHDVLNDCRTQVHFSKNIFHNYWSIVDEKIKDMINMLSVHTYDEFIKDIPRINIAEDINLLNNLSNITNAPSIISLSQSVKVTYNHIDVLFQNITNSNATLPAVTVEPPINEFKNYLQRVIESAIDACPLPLATIVKADVTVCHTTAASLNGLWLSIFFFLFLVTAGLCIFGLIVFKKTYL